MLIKYRAVNTIRSLLTLAQFCSGLTIVTNEIASKFWFKRLSLLATAYFFPCVISAATPDISGTYIAEGSGLGGNTYRGTATISAKGDAYRVRWQIDKTNEQYEGIGVLQGNVLAVSYQGEGFNGVIAYQVDPGRELKGVYTQSDGPGSGRLWSEVLTPRRRSVRVGDLLVYVPSDAELKQALSWMQPLLAEHKISAEPKLVKTPFIDGEENYVFFVIPDTQHVIAVGLTGRKHTTLGKNEFQIPLLLNDIYLVKTKADAEHFAFVHLLLARARFTAVEFAKPVLHSVGATADGGFQVRAEMKVVSSTNPRIGARKFVSNLKFDRRGKLERPPSNWAFRK